MHGSNPLSLIRSFPHKEIKIEDAIFDGNLEIDDLFEKKYIKFMKGESHVYLTRIFIDEVQRGFWKRVNKDWVLFEDEISEEFLFLMLERIRLGGRPAIFIYKNPNKNSNKKYVCPDDQVVLRAYQLSGVNKLPVYLLGLPDGLEESCLSMRNFWTGGSGGSTLLAGVIPIVQKSVPSFLGLEKPKPSESFDKLKSHLSNAKKRLKEFHVPGMVEFHYHHTLYSVLRRAEDSIESLKILIEAGKVLTAAGLLRSLYELALVFYVDWLDPNNIHKYFQMASVMSEADWKKRVEIMVGEMKQDVSVDNLEEIKKAHMRAFHLGSKVVDRARIFPLGENFHIDIYKFLSDIVHHDFSMTARFASALDDGDEAIFIGSTIKTILYLADIIVAAMVTRINDDVGYGSPQSSEKGG